MNNGVPYNYGEIMMDTAPVTPSTVHVTNTALSAFFRRYLFQDLLSVWEWDIPENWDSNYFKTILFSWGYFAVIDTPAFGIIPQQAGLKGYNVQYQPTNAVISNPRIKENLEPVINEECAIIRLRPDYCGMLDLVNYYGDMMALTAESLDVNILNSKLALSLIHI